MVIINKIRLKFSAIIDIAVLIILIVTQSPVHELGHAIAVKMLGGELDTIAVNIFAPAQSYVLYMFPYSDYIELCQAITKLSPHVLLGIIGFYMCHKGVNSVKLAGNSGKFTDFLIGLLYLGIGAGWFLPLRYLTILRYLKMKSYLQFDIPQAALHFLNFVCLRAPAMTLYLSKISIEFQVSMLILGLTGLSGIIYFTLKSAFHVSVAKSIS